MTNVVITMAGRGTRFGDRGWNVPKPLISVQGTPMYALVVNSLGVTDQDRLIFVCLEEHIRKFELHREIESRFSAFDLTIVSLDNFTRGQAETAWAAKSAIDPHQGLLIHNIDTIVKADLGRTLADYPEADGVLVVFSALGDSWSFTQLDDDDRVILVKEKERISDLASTGTYYFREPLKFGNLVETALVSLPAGDELFVAPLFNQLIADDAEVRICHAEAAWPLGTPEELHDFLTLHGSESTS